MPNLRTAGRVLREGIVCQDPVRRPQLVEHVDVQDRAQQRRCILAVPLWVAVAERDIEHVARAELDLAPVVAREWLLDFQKQHAAVRVRTVTTIAVQIRLDASVAVEVRIVDEEAAARPEIRIEGQA